MLPWPADAVGFPELTWLLEDEAAAGAARAADRDALADALAAGRRR